MSSNMTYEYESTSPEATSKLGETLADSLRGTETIVLVGDLGAGKTQFVRGLAAGLGSDEVVQSPTFTLRRDYRYGHERELHHYDFYRLGEAGVVGQEFEESVADPKVITVVEWAEVVKGILPRDVITIMFQTMGESSRTLVSSHKL